MLYTIKINGSPVVVARNLRLKPIPHLVPSLAKLYLCAFYRYANKDYVPDNRYRFKFGTSRRMSLRRAAAKIQEHIDDADFLVTHSGAHDTDFLASCGVSVSDKLMFDTQILATALLPNGPLVYSLKRLMVDLDISFDEDILHNGGNDAFYTMKVFLALTEL